MEEQSQSTWRIILRFGLLGSAVTFYFTAIGMVETFSQRNLIGTFVSLGHLFLVSGALGAGFMTARAIKNQPWTRVAGASLLAGSITSLFPIILTGIIQVFVVAPFYDQTIFNLRDMFVNFSPGIQEFLTFGRGLVLGNLLLVLFSAIMGGIGSAFILLPTKWRSAFLNAILWPLAIGLFSENISQIIQEILGRGLIKILFQNKSLNVFAAVIVFALAFAAGYFRLKDKANTRWAGLPPERQRKSKTIGLVAAVVLLLLLPWIVGLFLSQALFIIGLYVMMGLGLNIVVGYAGLLDLGYVAFFAFGAYTMGVLTTTSSIGLSGLNFWTALPIAVLAGVLWGVVLGFPVLQMRGDYLAIVTLGFGEIIRLLALSDWLAPIEGGAQGVLHIPTPSFFGISMSSPQAMYYLVILGSLLAAFVTTRLRESKLGRQWMAMREDEDVAEAMGINLVQSKLLAFGIGAAFSALAGAIFAARLGNIFPHSFNLLISINALSLIIVGGLGSIPGVVVGSLILVGLPELLREFAEYRLLMYGILLIVMMLVKPEGFLPEATRKRELLKEELTISDQPLEALGKAEG